MTNLHARWAFFVVGVVIVMMASVGAEAADIEIANKKFTAPEKFQRERPRSEIIAYEFTAPAAEGDEQTGRMTIMAAGGTVEQNIDRWYTQFTQPDGKSTKEAGKVEKKEIDGVRVHFVDLSGTFDDKPAPFAPGVMREKYRMLGAIVELPEGNVYFKFYGPRQTVAEHAEAFRAMIVDGLEKS